LPDGRVLAANRWILDLSGCNLDDLQRDGLATLHAHPAEFLDLLKNLPQAGPVRDWEMPLQRKDGTILHTLINIDFITLNGQPMLLTTVRDISDRKAYELGRWHNVMLGREGRVLEVKREVNELLARLGQPPRYPSAVEAPSIVTPPGRSDPP
jgi:PAS domain S-box-containing protein